MKVNSLKITRQDLELLRKAFGMFDRMPDFIGRLEQTMEYQCATVLNYRLDSIEFEETKGRL